MLSDMDRTFDFHGTTMTIKSLTSETGGIYTILYAIHQPNVGPTLHLHPRGNECFYIIKGQYKFILENKVVDAIPGDLIVVPKNTPHKFTVGNEGGEVLIISPPDLENYFSQVSDLLKKGTVTWELEYKIAQQYGQVFLENTNHWK
ncbi:MAG TPA: cupin domain-containing protein [Candidatus Nitrosotalea sp.]|nr:cupin domain-containing protein [Candidatus Nitrosotalea sp.]